jgi:lipoprotein-anchoring transpeptidase ErfK/SrfK
MLHRIILALFLAFAATPSIAANILVVVDIPLQTMHVRVDGVTKYRWDVSTGRAGYTTPAGRYQPIRMHKKWYSRKYDNAPMPHAIFFYEGYAIHGTTDLKRLGRIASHGCVRLHPDNAATLYSLVKEIGAENTIIRVQSAPQRLAYQADAE